MSVQLSHEEEVACHASFDRMYQRKNALIRYDQYREIWAAGQLYQIQHTETTFTYVRETLRWYAKQACGLSQAVSNPEIKTTKLRLISSRIAPLISDAGQKARSALQLLIPHKGQSDGNATDSPEIGDDGESSGVSASGDQTLEDDTSGNCTKHSSRV